MERKTKKRHNKHHLDKRILSKRRNTMSGGGTYDEYNHRFPDKLMNCY